MGLKPAEGRGSEDPSEKGGEGGRAAAFRYLAILSAAVAYLTVLLGAGVTFTDTPLICPTWPGCSPGQVIPMLGGPATIEFAHRLSALALSLSILALLLVAYLTKQARPGLRRLTLAAAVLVLVQALIGGAIIFSDAAFTVVVLHLGLATLLFGILIVIAAMANLPYLPPRWQASLLGSLTPVGAARKELDTMRPPHVGEGEGSSGPSAPASAP